MRLFKIVGIILLVFVFMLPSCAAPAPTSTPTSIPTQATTTAPLMLKAVHFSTDTVIKEWGYFWFIDRVKERSNGRIIIENKGGAETMKPPDSFSAVQSGVIDVNLGPASYHFASNQFAYLIHLAELNPNGTLVAEARAWLQKEYEAIGVHYVGRTRQWLPWCLYLKNKEAKTLQDLSNLKIAVSGSAHVAFAKSYAAVPVNIDAQADYYPALERGMVDGCQFGLDMYKFSMQEQIKYIVLPPFKTNNNGSIYMNLNTWNKLPKDLQNIISEVMISIETDGLKRDIENGQKDWDILVKAGLKTTTLSKEDAAKWITLYDASGWELVQKWNQAKYEEMRKLAVIGKGLSGLPF